MNKLTKLIATPERKLILVDMIHGLMIVLMSGYCLSLLWELYIEPFLR